MIRDNKQFHQILDKVYRHSYFIERIEYYTRLVSGFHDTVSEEYGRPLRDLEVAELEKQGNRAADWRLLRVADDFNPVGIWENTFFGNCYLGKFRSDTSRICRNIISNAIISDDVTLLNSSVYGPESTFVERFGIGTSCDPGLENGGRKLALIPDISWEMARYLCEHVADEEVKQYYRQIVNAYLKETGNVGYSIIENGSSIHNCSFLKDVYIGPFSSLRGAAEVVSSTIISDKDNPVSIGPGVICRDSIVQNGSSLDSGAIVEKCGVFSYTSIDGYAKASASLLGPETAVSGGEITASFAGPFIGFHHQSLLISAYWPDGKGNVGYGANIGSNHTSRQPDQEIWPGEGMFFGLSSSIKFPANFQNAPFSIIATGVTTLPQKMEFPFSCIVPPEYHAVGSSETTVPGGYNRVLPAWCIYRNMYMCIRSALKFAERSRTVWKDDFLEVFRLPVMEKVLKARESIGQSFNNFQKSKSGENLSNGIITGNTLKELGKNYTYTKDLEEAFQWYTYIIRYYCCKGIVTALDQPASGDTLALEAGGNGPFIEQLFLHAFSPDATLRQVAEVYKKVLLTMEDLTVSSREEDYIRGSSVIDDYSVTHTPIEEDPVIIEMKRQRARELDIINTKIL